MKLLSKFLLIHLSSIFKNQINAMILKSFLTRILTPVFIFNLILIENTMASDSEFNDFNSQSTARIDFLKAIKTEVLNCAVMKVTKTKDNNLEFKGIQSHCPTLKIFSQWQAQVYIQNEWLYATIFPSADSDGGDLNHLVIRDSYGFFIAGRRNVPAFNNVILALTSGAQLPIEELKP